VYLAFYWATYCTNITIRFHIFVVAVFSLSVLSKSSHFLQWQCLTAGGRRRSAPPRTFDVLGGAGPPH